MIRILLLLPLLCCYSSTHAYDIILQINGIISENGCVVDSNARELSVDMGTVASRDFTAGQLTSELVPFSIYLRNCSSLASGVKVTFEGTPDLADSSLLRLTEMNESASGIGIEILDKEKNPIPLNFASAHYSLTPNSDAELKFYSRYKSTAAVKPGMANATATFNLEYD
ncbi:fimbrial protein [Pantoea allii]|uniref:Type 1 fimbrial protein n=1 Tax=Pantoea allii TaxID=574096 RepID=A0ABS6VHM3_9GAMM|nr:MULTISPECIES: fimbrial protein [Pantoea]MBW1216172.1 type 1 fimbrial protein [Pantoea allii]MBW1258833.1 type 1 fimbrial protein [Pantoea allii]MBW1267918.1 type 1 fimbrial protein [Pantoea allii]MBW1289949.1 type 1 fimbrial protein [Pantoea allii]MDJ0034700.1 fimbrial protein [Pantoea allii]